MPKLRHLDNLNTARFVTFSCYRRLKLLTRPSVIRTFLGSLDEIRRLYCFSLWAYVVMPEHVHLVLHPQDAQPLGTIIGKIKSLLARRILMLRLIKLPDACTVHRNGHTRQAFWQPRCYDHNCRCNRAVVEKIRYCHRNPVRRGLVSAPDQWRWSSYNWYAGESDVPLEMDTWEVMQ